MAVNKNPYYCKKLCPFLGKRLRGLSAYCTMYNNCKEKEVFSSAIFHKHCLKSGQINYHEKELVFFLLLLLWQFQSNFSNVSQNYSWTLDLHFFLDWIFFSIESSVLNVIKHENYWNSILQVWSDKNWNCHEKKIQFSVE